MTEENLNTDGIPAVIDVDEADFERDVIERSKELPVVVDFWAPWCGPCRFLGPVLEGLVNNDFKGQMILAKVNTDSAPELSQKFRIRGIPAVKIFRDGEVVAEFVGALPEDEARKALAAVLPNEADGLVAEARQLDGADDRAQAEQKLRAALELDNMHPGALLLLGSLQEKNDAIDDAIDSYRRIPQGAAETTEGDQRIASLEIRREATAIGDKDALEARVQSDDSDLDARYGVALHLAATGLFEDSLTALYDVIARDRSFKDEAPRKAMLKVFELVGARSELAETFRAKLAKLLY